MKLLICPVNKAAFDMLRDPNPDTRKMEEYRGTSNYWIKRFIEFYSYGLTEDPMVYSEFIECLMNGCRGYKDFDEMLSEFGARRVSYDAVKFTNGYGNKVPYVIREWKGLTIENPEPKWVPEAMQSMCDKPHFAILLGEIIEQSPS